MARRKAKNTVSQIWITSHGMPNDELTQAIDTLLTTRGFAPDEDANWEQDPDNKDIWQICYSTDSYNAG